LKGFIVANMILITLKRQLYMFKCVFYYSGTVLQIEMTNKSVSVGIVRTRPRFDGESPH